ncbi:MAG: DUF2147 domain-containing protein [Bacteroidetes bacterium]|nr:DUF2147 domain-containing protein [Bacteroidota bacterium]
MRLTLIALLMALCLPVFSQADKIVGFWLTQGGDSQVQIYKSPDNKYFGTIKWLKNPTENGKPKLDKKNPNDKLKQRPLKELVLLSGFVFNQEDKQWVNGTIYDPKNGSTYKCYMWFEPGNDNVLHVKGYIGVSWIGRKVEWTRETALRK